MVIDIIGVMYDLSNPDAPEALTGYHVNSLEDVPEWIAFKVTPVTPARVFMGVGIAHCYKFHNKDHFESLIEEG